MTNPNAGAPGQTVAPEKSFITTWLFALILGYLGVDRFYLGKIGTGILKLITVGGFGLWYLIDLILVLTGSQRDKLRRPLAGYETNKRLAWIVTGGLIVLSIVFSGFAGAFVAFLPGAPS